MFTCLHTLYSHLFSLACYINYIIYYYTNIFNYKNINYIYIAISNLAIASF